MSATTPRGANIRDWLERHRTTAGLAGAVASGALAWLWLVVVPGRADEVGGLQEVAIRYGHSACWALLALAALLYAVRAPRPAVAASAWTALAAYLAFLAAVVL